MENRSTLSRRLSHFFHVVSNIRPVVWIGLYVCLTPVFALIYWALPDGQFRVPDGAGTDFGSWLYYSIVTITTLGFGDYTPAHGWAQAVTAIEVMCGLIFLGFFLNAVGSMKSEIDVESEAEKQRRVHRMLELDKLRQSVPLIRHNLHVFLEYCYAVTTPMSKREESDARYNPDFTFADMSDMYKPSGLPFDRTRLPAVARMVRSAGQTSLSLDSLETRIDLTLWPDILEDCFTFVANYQMFSAADALSERADMLTGALLSDGATAEQALSGRIAGVSDPASIGPDSDLRPVVELYHFIKENAQTAHRLNKALESAMQQEDTEG